MVEQVKGPVGRGDELLAARPGLVELDEGANDTSRFVDEAAHAPEGTALSSFEVDLDEYAPRPLGWQDVVHAHRNTVHEPKVPVQGATAIGPDDASCASLAGVCGMA